MYMNVLPVCGHYRGISRTLTIPKIKAGQNWDDLFSDFEQYVAWRVAGGRVYRWGMFQLLSKFCAKLNRYSSARAQMQKLKRFGGMSLNWACRLRAMRLGTMLRSRA